MAECSSFLSSAIIFSWFSINRAVDDACLCISSIVARVPMDLPALRTLARSSFSSNAPDSEDEYPSVRESSDDTATRRPRLGMDGGAIGVFCHRAIAAAPTCDRRPASSPFNSASRSAHPIFKRATSSRASLSSLAAFSARASASDASRRAAATSAGPTSPAHSSSCFRRRRVSCSCSVLMS